jgi:hypothetical protein
MDYAHASNLNAVFVIYPCLTKSIQTTTLLAHQRKLEDKLLLYQANMDTEVVVVYKDPDHGSDRRPLTARCRLVVSERFAETSPWLSSDACRGRIAGVPLQRIKDMKPRLLPTAISVAGPLDVDKVLSPGDRLRQRGAPACLAILASVLRGVDIGLGSAVHIVELSAVDAQMEWALGAFELDRRRLSDATLPRVGFVALTLSQEHKKAYTMQLEQFLMTNWWEGRELAGSAIPTLNEKLPSMPTLQMLCQHEGVPSIPDILFTKFPEESVYFRPWTDLCSASAAKLLEMFPKTTQANTSTVGDTHPVGPDYKVSPLPPVFEEIKLTEISLADFKQEDVYGS